MRDRRTELSEERTTREEVEDDVGVEAEGEVAEVVEDGDMTVTMTETGIETGTMTEDTAAIGEIGTTTEDMTGTATGATMILKKRIDEGGDEVEAEGAETDEAVIETIMIEGGITEEMTTTMTLMRIEIETEIETETGTKEEDEGAAEGATEADTGVRVSRGKTLARDLKTPETTKINSLNPVFYD